MKDSISESLEHLANAGCKPRLKWSPYDAAWSSLVSLWTRIPAHRQLTSDTQQAILTCCTTPLKQPKQPQLWSATNENVTVVGRNLPTVHIVSRMCMFCITTGRTKCVACNHVRLQQKGGLLACTALATLLTFAKLNTLLQLSISFSFLPIFFAFRPGAFLTLTLGGLKVTQCLKLILCRRRTS